MATRPETNNAKGYGNPNLITVKAEVYPPIPINPACANDNLPVRIMRFRLTDRIMDMNVLMITFRMNSSDHKTGIKNKNRMSDKVNSRSHRVNL